MGAGGVRWLGSGAVSRRPLPPSRGRPTVAGPSRKRLAREARAAAFVRRPFDGRADETDLVALREVVPSATAPLALAPGPAAEHPDRAVTLATVLPLAWPALVRRDGSVVLALQTPPRSGDLALDLGQALLAALAGEPGAGLGIAGPGSPRLQELVAPDPVAVTVHPGFDWWLADADAGALAEDVTASLEQANAGVVPTARLASVSAAYWCRIGDRCHLRWALPEQEESLLDGLARLHVGGGLGLGDGTRYAGAFRAHGIVMPVWDLPASRVAEEMEGPAAAFRDRLDDALTGGSLTAGERRARAGVVGRQLTLR